MRVRLTLVVAVSALALAACSRGSLPDVRVETVSAPLSSAAAEKLAASADISAFASVETSEAPALRARALGQLRAEGEDGSRTAELLTTGFPPLTASVPVLVRFCTVDGADAVVVVEAYGDAGGTLTHRRLWVFDPVSGALVRAASFL
jgi:hypothetical protein